MGSESGVDENVDGVVEIGELGSRKGADDDNIAGGQALKAVGPRAISGDEKVGVGVVQQYLRKGFKEERIALVLDEAPSGAQHQRIGACGNSPGGSELGACVRIWAEALLIDAVEDDMYAFGRDLVDCLEDVAHVVAGGHMVCVARKELHLLHYPKHTLRQRFLQIGGTALARLAVELPHDVGVNDLVGDAVP